MKFASQVLLISSRYGFVRRVHAQEARRLVEAGSALVMHPKGMITELLLPDHGGSKGTGHPSNSLRAGYVQTLSGGERLRIETEKELAREVVTLPCRVHTLKKIATELRPIYRAAVLENLVSA